LLLKEGLVRPEPLYLRGRYEEHLDVREQISYIREASDSYKGDHMDEKKKNFIVPLSLAVVLFLAGVILGFSIWGVDRREQVDYKQTLREVIDYIATIEHRNENLRERVGTLETDLAVAREQKQESAQQRTDDIASLKRRIEALQKENQQLRSALEPLAGEAETGGISPGQQQEPSPRVSD